MKLWLRYYLRTFLFTGLLAMAAGAVLQKQLGDTTLAMLVITMLVQLAPFLSYLTVRKKAASKLYFKPTFNLWLLLALLVPVILLILAAFILQFMGLPYQPSAFAAPKILPVAILTTLIGALAEEIGWRGFMLSELVLQKSPFVASLMTGALWGVWHITKIQQVGFVGYLLFVIDITLMGILLGYLFFKSGRNLLHVTLFHAVNNITTMFLLYERESIPFYLVLIALKLVVIVLLWIFDRAYFQPKEPELFPMPKH